MIIPKYFVQLRRAAIIQLEGQFYFIITTFRKIARKIRIKQH